jgi:hypothetical protein
MARPLDRLPCTLIQQEIRKDQPLNHLTAHRSGCKIMFHQGTIGPRRVIDFVRLYDILSPKGTGP